MPSFPLPLRSLVLLLISPQKTIMLKYLQRLSEKGGAGWNRFWYTPSDPYTLGVMRLLVGLVMTYWYLTLIN